MRAQSIISRQWLAACIAAAAFAFALGSSEWAGRLLACPGKEGCLGGCLMVNGDGQYADENYCEVTLCNEFVDQMGIFCRSAEAQVAGPNVQPVKDGGQVFADTSAQPSPNQFELPCDLIILQEATTTGNPLQLIDHTICPPQT